MMTTNRSHQFLTSLLIALILFENVFGFQNLFKNTLRTPRTSAPSSSATEQDLLQAIEDLGDKRLANSQNVKELILKLEQSNSIPQPAIAPEVYGRWRLLHTDNADTASPIQRKAVDSSKFAIYQDIVFNSGNQLVVSQVVKFSESAELKVDALASTSAYPLQELTERKGDGTFLGLNLLGVSLVGQEAKADENRPDSRIDFVFDEGRFELGENLSIPYPVPFRLPIFRDAVKGWIDITYMSEKLRISRGNKGTTFILLKEDP
jgi:hypothetical protein